LARYLQLGRKGIGGGNLMNGLIETAIEREAERLDVLLEAAGFVPPFVALGHFRSCLNPLTGKFEAGVTSRRRFSTRTATASRYAN
jgi:hypothetical protein